MVFASFNSKSRSVGFASESNSEATSAAYMFAARLACYEVDVIVARGPLYLTVSMAGAALDSREVHTAIAIEANSACRAAEFMHNELRKVG